MYKDIDNISSVFVNCLYYKQFIEDKQRLKTLGFAHVDYIHMESDN